MKPENLLRVYQSLSIAIPIPQHFPIKMSVYSSQLSYMCYMMCQYLVNTNQI